MINGKFDEIRSLTGKDGPFFKDNILLGRKATAGNEIVTLSQTKNLFFNPGTGLAYFQDQETQNTAGVTYTANQWQTVVVNTSVINNIQNCYLENNQIFLPPGNYFIEGNVMGRLGANGTSNHCQCRLFNATTNTMIKLGFSQALSNVDNSGGLFINLLNTVIHPFVTITVSSTIALQLQQDTSRIPAAANFDTEVYASLLILQWSTI